MLSFIYGILGAFAVIALCGGGFFLGWTAKGKTAEFQHHEAEKKYTEAQIKSMRQMDEALNHMMEYSAETAYGLNRGLEED